MKLVTMSKIAKVSRSADNTGIPVIGLSKRSYRRTLMIITVAINKFKLHFKPVQKDSSNIKIKAVCPGNFPNRKCSDHHTNYNQRQCIPPNKLQSLYQAIQSTLQFMNGSNLHHQQQFYLTGHRISQIMSKKHKLNSVISMLFQNHSMTCKDWIWVPNLNSTNCAYSAKQQFKQ